MFHHENIMITVEL